MLLSFANQVKSANSLAVRGGGLRAVIAGNFDFLTCSAGVTAM